MTPDRTQRLLALARARRDLLAVAVLMGRLRSTRYVPDVDYPMFTGRARDRRERVA